MLHAAGALPLDELVRLVVKRAICLERCIAGLAPEASGGMLVIREPLARSEQRLAAFSDLTLANRNAPNQGVVLVEKDLDMEEEINWMMGSGMYIHIGANVRAYWQKSNKAIHSEIMYALIEAYWNVHIYRMYPAWIVVQI